MPKVLGFGAHESHTRFDDVRLFAQQGICQSAHLNLRHRFKLCELHESNLHHAQRNAVQGRAGKVLAKLDSAAPRVPCNRLLGVISAKCPCV